ncbi:hypothetical protein [Rhodohalobacter sp. 8-1]|uniref:hypothetical protein n=1 Tax=Rhodohalobacter sp. 8-1 TaxID=3131972 RepID=UPI0030EC0490
MKYEDPVKLTNGFQKMIEFAEELSKARDFIRMDFMYGDNFIFSLVKLQPIQGLVAKISNREYIILNLADYGIKTEVTPLF